MVHYSSIQCPSSIYHLRPDLSSSIMIYYYPSSIYHHPSSIYHPCKHRLHHAHSLSILLTDWLLPTGLFFFHNNNNNNRPFRSNSNSLSQQYSNHIAAVRHKNMTIEEIDRMMTINSCISRNSSSSSPSSSSSSNPKLKKAALVTVAAAAVTVTDRLTYLETMSAGELGGMHWWMDR